MVRVLVALNVKGLWSTFCALMRVLSCYVLDHPFYGHVDENGCWAENDSILPTRELARKLLRKSHFV